MQNNTYNDLNPEDDNNKDELTEQPDVLVERESSSEEEERILPQGETSLTAPGGKDFPKEEVVEDITTTEIGMTDEVTEVESAPEQLKPSEEADGKFRRVFRHGIRWTMGVLIIFGLGLLAGIFLFYRPTVREAKNASNQFEAELSARNENITELENQIADLQAEISSLQPLKVKNDEILAENQDLKLHIAILDARVDVANARLILKEGNNAQVRITLNQTSRTLNTIGELLETEQRGVFSDLKQRLDLVMEELDEDPYAAQSDLDVLETTLLKLQDSLFNE